MSFPYTYLRLSVTDRCNLHCSYCQPVPRSRFLSGRQTLSLDEFLLLVRELSGYGIKHVRLTGGEPLLRKDLDLFIRSLDALDCLEVLSLTTNGCLLSGRCRALKEDGIRKVNISLDTLKPGRFKRLTGTGAFEKVKDAVREAASAGFGAVKVNCVLIKDFNDDEIFDFVELGSRLRIDVRFIEYFPTRSGCDNLGHRFLPSDAVKKLIEGRYGRMEFLGRDPLAGPAQYFRLKGGLSRIGFISSVTDFFCPDCNRLRLTCDGKLYPCLHSSHHWDLKKSLRENEGGNVRASIEDIFFSKKYYNKFTCPRSFEMSSIGG